jgi:predicted nucleic acid-binding protein
LIVVDASALADFLLGRSAALSVLGDEFAAQRRERRLHAPEIAELETLNALRRMVRNSQITARRGTEAVADLRRAPLIRYPHAPLRERIWQLRDELSAYDAAYLALAEGLRRSVLVTSDRGMASRARISLSADRVRLIP